MAIETEQHQCTFGSHTTHYLASGPEDGPLVIFVHGWPELSISWRNQLPVFGGLGFRAIAPDMRGYGASTVYDRHDSYALEHIVGDMLELLEHLGRESAVWVGHDWGSPVVWSMANHYPEKCSAVASLCVPYLVIEKGLDFCISLVDRSIYPVDKYPAGQWEYMRYYEENFEDATREMEANTYNTVKLLFRKGNPDGQNMPAGTAMTRINGGWFGSLGEAPDIPRDGDVVSDGELNQYADGLKSNGFFGPNSWYMNHAANKEYTARAANGGHLDMPALFIGALYDYTCETATSRSTEPMKEYCRNLTVKMVKTGHWMAQENPAAVNAILLQWLAKDVPHVWPSAD